MPKGKRKFILNFDLFEARRLGVINTRDGEFIGGLIMGRNGGYIGDREHALINMALGKVNTPEPEPDPEPTPQQLTLFD